MGKIPVGATIAHAYRFVFRDFFPILGVVWLPWAILSASGYLFMRQSLTFSTAMAVHDFTGVWHALILLVPFYILMLILLFVQIAGIAELALGLRKPSFYYFSLATPVWRLIGAYLLLTLLIVVFYLVLLVGGILLTAVTALLAKLLPPVGSILLGIVAVVAFIAAFCAYVYALVRTSFLLAPIVLAEATIGLKRSWALGRGNFWRIFVVLLAILLPICILQCIFMFGFVFHGFPPMPPPHASAEQLAATQAAISAWNTAMMSNMYGNWYITFPIFGIFTVLFYGLGAGAQCFAYQALTRNDSAPIAGD